MGIEALALLIAKSLAPALAKQLAGAVLPQERVARWLRRDPPRLALAAALAAALADVRARHPEPARAFFDEVFLASDPVVALLARCVPPGEPPSAEELAALYAGERGADAVARATPLAADFLSSFREQLRHSEPFRALFDSEAADALVARLDALPDLLAQLDRAPQRLRGHIKPVTTVRERRTEHFVGRRFVLDALDERLLTEAGGYVLVRGEPGIGKSALMAELVRTRDYVHHFNVATDGIRTADQFLRNACAQLIQRYALPYDELPADAGRDAGFLDVLLREAVAGERPVVLVVDALDEAEAPDARHGVNRLSLPAALPDGAYVVASIRTGVDDMLQLERRMEPVELREDDPRNLADVRAYVDAFLARRADVMPSRLREWDAKPAAFADAIVAHSAGNFMYLVHVLDGIAAGSITRATFGSLDGLPNGLRDYYRRHWRAMQDADPDRFEALQRPVIGMLATAPGAVTADKVAEWINASGEFEPVSPRAVKRVLEHEWRQFLNEEPGDPPRWRIYHASFLAFLAEAADLGALQRAGVAATGAKVRWDA